MLVHGTLANLFRNRTGVVPASLLDCSEGSSLRLYISRYGKLLFLAYVHTALCCTKTRGGLCHILESDLQNALPIPMHLMLGSLTWPCMVGQDNTEILPYCFFAGSISGLTKTLSLRKRTPWKITQLYSRYLISRCPS